jgi:hypothetical protein
LKLYFEVMAMNHPKNITHPDVCCESAEKILDQSQGHPSYSSSNPGHPRYHVLCNKNFDKFTILSDLPSLGCTEAVTEAMGQTKTAFLSKADQNACLHDILTTKPGREAIQLLNQGQNEVLLRVAVDQLPRSHNVRMMEVVRGDQMEEQPVRSVVLILGHHVDKAEGKYVHVKTFYPTNRLVYGYEIEKLR